MSFICDPCLRAGEKILASFVIEDVGIQRIISCCDGHLAEELRSQLQRGERVMVRRGEINGAAPAPPRPPP